MTNSQAAILKAAHLLLEMRPRDRPIAIISFVDMGDRRPRVNSDAEPFYAAFEEAWKHKCGVPVHHGLLQFAVPELCAPRFWLFLWPLVDASNESSLADVLDHVIAELHRHCAARAAHWNDEVSRIPSWQIDYPQQTIP